MRCIIFVLSLLFCSNNIAFAWSFLNHTKKENQLGEKLKRQALQRSTAITQSRQYDHSGNQLYNILYTDYAPSDYLFKNLLKNKNARGKINELLQRNAHKSQTPTSVGYAAILPLIINRNMDFLRAIYKSNSLDFTRIKIDVFGNNILHLLILADWQEGIKFIENKYKKQYKQLLNTPNNFGITPQKLLAKLKNKQSNNSINLVGFDHVIVFAIMSKNKEVIEILEAQARDKKQFYNQTVDNFGNTILHIMVASNYIKGTKYIVEKCNSYQLNLGNRVNKNGFTPCHIGAAINNSKCCDLLLDINNYMPEYTRTALGTPLHIAIRNYGLYNFEKKEAIRTVWILSRYVSEEVSNNRQKKHSFLNIPDKLGNTPLHLAAMIAKPRFVLYLLSAGSDPRLYNNQKKAPFDVIGTTLFKDRKQIDVLQSFLLGVANNVAERAISTGNNTYKITTQHLASILEKNKFKDLFTKLLNKYRTNKYQNTASELLSEFLSTKPPSDEEPGDI